MATFKVMGCYCEMKELLRFFMTVHAGDTSVSSFLSALKALLLEYVPALFAIGHDVRRL